MAKIRYYSLFVALVAYLFMPFEANAIETMGRLPGAKLTNFKTTKHIPCSPESSNPPCSASDKSSYRVKEVDCEMTDPECVKTYLGSCDPMADYTLDDNFSGANSFRKSCGGTSGSDITRTTFSVPVDFWPAQPCVGTPCVPTGAAITYRPSIGPPMMPKSYLTKTEDSSITFNLGACPNPVPSGYSCTAMTKVYTDAGTELDITSTTVANASFEILAAGSEIKCKLEAPTCAVSGVNVYPTAPTNLKHPSSGDIQGPTGAYTSTYINNTTNQQVASGCTVDDTAAPAANTCRQLYANNTTNAIVNGQAPATCNINALPTGCHLMQTPVVQSYTYHRNYLTTNGNDGTEPNGGVVGAAVANGATIKNTIAVGNKAKGSVSCVVGATAVYTSGEPIMSKDCELIRDLGRCNGADPCNEYLVAGADVYVAGSISKQISTPVKSVTSQGAEKTFYGSPFTSTFYDSPDDHPIEQESIIKLPKGNYLVLSPGGGLASSGIPPGFESTLVSFELVYEGSKACVYARRQDPEKIWRVEGEYPKNLYDVFGQVKESLPMCTSVTDPRYIASPKTCSRIKPTSLDDTRITRQVQATKHCVEAPPLPVNNASLIWGAMISSVCTKYDSSSSQFFARDGAGNKIPRKTAAGVDIPNEYKKRSFTGVVAECIEDSMLKIFFPGATMVDGVFQQPSADTPTFFSSMQKRIQSTVRAVMALYLIFFGYKLMMGQSAPKPEEWKWLFMKFTLVSFFALSSGMSYFLPKMLNASKYLSVIVMEAGLSDDNNASYAAGGADKGYKYCDFREYKRTAQTDPSSTAEYPVGKNYMALWDMVDCKFSKYLGIGDNASLPDAPQVLLVAALAPISTAYGIPIFFFSLMTTAVIIMIIVRVVHIYIMSVIGLVILAYIAPLVVPAVFFERTKPIFKNWLEQLMAMFLQPIILFGMLSFLLVAIDSVVFGDNHYFKNDKIENTTGIVTPSNKACSASDSKCKDKYSLGYLYQVTSVDLNPWPADEFYFFKIWSLSFNGDGNDKYMFFALLRLLIAVFIVYSIFSMAEEVAGSLVGGSVASLSAAPVAGPAAVMTGVAAGIAGAKDAALKVGNAAKHYKSTAESVKNSAVGRAAGAVSGGVSSLAKSVSGKKDGKDKE